MILHSGRPLNLDPGNNRSVNLLVIDETGNGPVLIRKAAGKPRHGKSWAIIAAAQTLRRDQSTENITWAVGTSPSDMATVDSEVQSNETTQGESCPTSRPHKKSHACKMQSSPPYCSEGKVLTCRGAETLKKPAVPINQDGEHTRSCSSELHQQVVIVQSTTTTDVFLANLTTLSEMLPKTNCLIPERPLLPITMVSYLPFSASFRISLAMPDFFF